MKLIDSHCHIHDTEFFGDNREEVYQRAVRDDIGMICVGTDERSSVEAVKFASAHKNTWAAIGVHPHDTKDGWGQIEQILDIEAKRVTRGGAAPTFEEIFDFSKEGADRVAGPAPSDLRVDSERICYDGSGRMGNDWSSGRSSISKAIVAIGEIGLDYFYNNSPRETQIRGLEEQLQLAVDYNLPVSFHIREAFDDFWPIFDNFHGVRGVLHSFTDTQENVDRGFSNGLYVGVNGISTFTRDTSQQKMYQNLPLDRILVETDAPFLTPHPLRGKMNEPGYVKLVVDFWAQKRGISFDGFANSTMQYTKNLFGL